MHAQEETLVRIIIGIPVRNGERLGGHLEGGHRSNSSDNGSADLLNRFRTESCSKLLAVELIDD